jgi:hypothetical protein
MATLGVSDVHYYHSTMSGAPTLRYLAGSLIGILDACLINGFGSQAAQGSWEKVFTGTNLAVYRSTDPNSTRLFLRVNDTALNDARVVGYETMSDVNTGTGPFPTGTQLSGGLYIRKSPQTTYDPRTWALYCDSRAFYFVCRPADPLYNYGWSSGLYFGDIVSYKSDDAFHCAILANPGSTGEFVLNRIPGNVAGNVGAYIARGKAQTGASLTFIRYAHRRHLFVGDTGSYPSPDGKLHVWPVEGWDNDTALRGRLPGFFSPDSGTSVADGTIITDNTDGYAGRNFLIRMLSYSSSLYHGAFDLTGPWRDDGSLSIEGKVTEKLVPGAYRVQLYRQSDMSLLKTVWSDANGDYSFTGLKSQKYTLVVVDHTDPLRSAAIKSDVIPS